VRRPFTSHPAPERETRLMAHQPLDDDDGLSGRLAVRSYEAGQITTLGQSTIEVMARRGEIPHVRCGRTLLFSAAALRQWLFERAMASVGEPFEGHDTQRGAGGDTGREAEG
jgi:excisionase family DNA binding protein